jgi:hypothetical protein
MEMTENPLSRHQDGRPIVVVFPGASLMAIRPVPGGIEVRCPGCDGVQRFPAHAGRVGEAAFLHEDHCPVQARIRAAIDQYEQQHVRHG